MNTKTEILTQKFGPLPVWAWGVGLGGAMIAWQKIRGGRAGGEADAAAGEGSAPATVDATLPVPEPLVTRTTMGSWTGEATPAHGSAESSNTVPASGDSGPATTNAQWLSRAVQYGSGYGWGATTTTSIVTKWLGGTALTQDEKAKLNVIVQGIGMPPDPPVDTPSIPTVTPTTTVVTPTTTPTVTPPRPTVTPPTPPRPPRPPRPTVTPPRPATPRPPATIRAGQRTAGVQMLQRALLAINPAGRLPQTGVYDAATIKAVGDFQRFFKLGESGGRTVGPITWGWVALLYSIKTKHKLY